MQRVAAFSQPAAVPAVPSAARQPSLWILSSWRDLLLYVGTPLVILPVFALAQVRWSAQDIYLFVAAFGAMGHHLPGMMRAYGDRALFQRFKWRFVLAPVFLAAVCVAFYWRDLKGITLVVFLWGVWHGMMQTYGFCRIYDAKMGSFAALTRRLDFALCIVWFATAVLLSSMRMSDTLDIYYASGGPVIPPALMHGIQQVTLAIAALVTLLFFGNFGWAWSRGQRSNPVKVALLVTSISFWWYCNNGVENILAGIALFEVFHDVQYLSLVWIYNRKRVESDSTMGNFMRFVFRRSGSLAGLYVGLVFAYGSLALVNNQIGVDAIKRVLTGVVTASALLHFYYDGFIWKVRESSTRQSLGLEGGTTAVAAGQRFAPWLLHGFKWAAAFVLPLGALWFWQARSTASEVDRHRWVAEDLPHGARSHYNYAVALQASGRLAEAESEFNAALRIKPNYDLAQHRLATDLAQQGRPSAAVAHFQEALRLRPDDGETHFDFANTLTELGRAEEAEREYGDAIRLQPKFAPAHYRLANLLALQNKLPDAVEHYEAALHLKPAYAAAELDLANALVGLDKIPDAKPHYEEALRLDPNLPTAHNNLGLIYLQEGKRAEAIREYREALRIVPEFSAAEENLRLATSDTP